MPMVLSGEWAVKKNGEDVILLSVTVISTTHFRQGLRTQARAVAALVDFPY
jgi:hypothetical protein